MTREVARLELQPADYSANSVYNRDTPRPDYTYETACIRKNAHKYTPDSRYDAALVLLEQAHGEHAIGTAASMLAESEHLLTSVLDLGKLRSGKLDQKSASATLHVAQLPNHAAIIASGTLPRYEVVDKAYGRSLMVSTYILEAANQRWADRNRKRELSGVLGEISVLALLQRYPLGNSTEKLPIPNLGMTALYSGDNANKRHQDSLNHAWDIEVIRDTPQGIATDYRIQVKTAKSDRSNTKREKDVDGINRIHIAQDLRLDDDKTFNGARQIITECIRERYNNDHKASSKLNARTEKLLSILDPLPRTVD